MRTIKQIMLVVSLYLILLLAVNISSAEGVNFKLWDILGHGDINSIVYSPNGDYLAVDVGNNIKIYDTDDWSTKGLLTGHSSSVKTLAFSPDGKMLASGSFDNTIKLWRVFDGTLIDTFEGHSASVYSIAFSPNGETLGSVAYGNKIKLWQVSSGTLLNTMVGDGDDLYRSIAFSPDGTILASGGSTKSTHGYTYSQIKLWRVSDGELLRTFLRYTSAVNSIAFSPDGVTLASGGDDRDIRLWNVSNGTLLNTITDHYAVVTSVAFSPDGVTLASGGGTSAINLWRVSDGVLVSQLTGLSHSVNAIAFSPDGSTLASGSTGNLIKIWNINNQTQLLAIGGHSDVVSTVAFSPDSSVLASGSDDYSIKLWNVNTRLVLRTLVGHSDDINSIAFSPNGGVLASGSDDDTVKLWQSSDGSLLRTITDYNIKSVAFSPDGATLASGNGGNQIKLWRVSDGVLLNTLSPGFMYNYVNSVAFSPDGTLLASGFGGGSDSYSILKIWRVSDGELLQTLSDHSGVVYSVEFSPDGDNLASASGDHTIKLWQVSNWTLIKTLTGHSDRVLSVTFSQDGSMLASCGHFYDPTVRLWNVNSGSELYTLHEHSGYHLSVAFSPDGSKLASASGNDTIGLWIRPSCNLAVPDLDSIPDVICENETEFSWSSNESLFYDVTINDNPILHNIVETTIKLPQGFTYNPGVNTWQVTARDCNGNESLSDVGVFNASSSVTLTEPTIVPKADIYCDNPSEEMFEWYDVDSLTYDMILNGSLIQSDILGSSIKLPANHQYESSNVWSVIARNCIGDEAESTTDTFSMNASTSVSSPQFTYPANGDEIYCDNTITWTYPGSTDGILFDIINNDGSTVYAENIDALSWTPTGEERFSDGTYFLRVRAKNCAGDYQDSAAVYFTVNNTPLAPVLSSPAPNNYTNYFPTFTWTVNGTQKPNVTYTVYLDDEILISGLTRTTVTAIVRTHGQHSWRVEAVGCMGASNDSGSNRYFNVDAVDPEEFELVWPENDGWINYSTGVPFDWEDAIDLDSGFDSYTLTVDGRSFDSLEDSNRDVELWRTYTGWMYIPSTSAEDSYLADAAYSRYGYYNRELWIGLSDRSSEGTWISEETNAVSSYFHWAGGEPSGDGDCAELRAHPNLKNWNDIPCSTSQPYLCAFPYDETMGCPSGYSYISALDICGKWSTSNASWTTAQANCNQAYTMYMKSGSVEWHVTAFDNVGNSHQSATYVVNIDKVNPSSPAGSIQDIYSDNGLPVFTWTAATDELSGIGEYQIFIDGELENTADGETLTWTLDTRTLSEGIYDWKIRALDKAGNYLDSSTAQVYVDNTAPVSITLVDVTPHGDGDWVSSPLPTFSFVAEDNAEGSGIGTYEVYVDGVLNQSSISECSPYWCTSSYNPLFDGPHEWYVIAYDNVGLSVTSETDTFTVDMNSPASFNHVAPAHGSIVNTQIPLICWEHTTDAGSGMKEYKLEINKVGTGLVFSQTYPEDGLQGDYCVRVNSELDNGDYTWLVTAYDYAGKDRTANSGSSWTMTIDEDIYEPTTSVTTPENNGDLVGCNNYDFAGNAWDPGPSPTSPSGSGVVSVEVQMDSDAEGGWIPATLSGSENDRIRSWSWTWSDSQTGSHILYVRATDQAGNTQTTATQRTIDVDCAGPNPFGITSPDNGDYTLACPSFTWESTTDTPAGMENGGYYELRINNGVGDDTVFDAGLATTYTLTGENCLTEGEYTWYVKAYDRLNNPKRSSSTHTLYVDLSGPGGFSLQTREPVNQSGWATIDACNNGRSVTVTWSAVTDDLGPGDGSGIPSSPYQVFLDGNPVGSRTSALTKTFSGLNDGNHTWTVKAYDNLGNESAATVTGDLDSFKVDCTGPGLSETASMRLYANDIPPSARDTGLDIESGDTVRIWADGELCFSDNRACDPSLSYGSCMGPEGQTSFPSNVIATKFYQEMYFGKVLALVGSGTADPYEVGTGATYTFDTAGDLKLAVNDNDQFNCKSRWHSVTLQKGDGFNLLFPVNNTLTLDTTPTFEWTEVTDEGIGVQRLEFILDDEVVSGQIDATATKFSLASTDHTLTEGTHRWKIKAYDTIGNSTTSPEWMIRVDLSPPSPFSLVPPEGEYLDNATPDLCWNLTTDAMSDIAHYLVYIDGMYNTAQYPNENCTQPAQALDDGLWCYSVVAQDELRWETESSEERCFTIDTNSPDAFGLVSPEDQEEVYTDMPEFCWEYTTDQGTGVQRYELHIGGTHYDVEQPDEPPVDGIICTQPTGPLPGPFPITYDWHVSAIDGADRTTDSETRQVIIDKDVTPPEVVILAPTSGEIFGSSGISMNGTAIDGERGTGVSVVQVFVQANPASNIEADYDDEAETWTASWPVEASGSITLCVRSMDHEGNWNPESGDNAYPCVTVRRDIDPPDPFDILAPSGNLWVMSRPVFTWQVTDDNTDGIGLEGYWLDISGNAEEIWVPKQLISVVEYQLTANQALPDGSYSWTVRAVDQYNNSQSATSSGTFRVDGLMPNQTILDSPADTEWLNDPTPELCWQTTEDNGDSGVAEYIVRINGSQHSVSGALNCYTVSGSLTNGDYTWDVEAIDTAGNHGPVSISRTFRLDLDAPPTPTPTYPDDGMHVHANPPEFYWQQVNDLPPSNFSGVCAYVISLNGVENEVGPSENSMVWSSAVSDGENRWKLRAKDCAGNYSSWSQERVLLLDTVVPDSPIITSPGADSWGNDATPTITWQASNDDYSGICSYLLTLDGNEVDIEVPTLSYTPGSDLAEGLHLLSLKAKDCAGNESSAATRSFNIDVTQPEIPTLLSPVNSSCLNEVQPTVEWNTVSDVLSGVATIDIEVDGEIVATESSVDAVSLQLPDALEEGNHEWRIVVRDQAGNSTVSSTWSFTIDVTDPTIEILSLADGATETEFVVNGSATGEDACGLEKVQVKFDDGEWIDAEPDDTDGWFTWSATFEWPIEGEHSITARSFDGAGNASEESTVSATFSFCNILCDCDEETAVCSTPKPDNTVCNDGNACTQTDTCQSGICEGTDPLVCEALDQCHISGQCDPESGECSNPNAENETPCNADDSGCTISDACQDGLCVAGDAPDCSSQDDQCNEGACESTGENTFTCVKNPVPLQGQGCNADTDGCTVGDQCLNGTCVAGMAPDCSDESDQCNTGVCSSTGSNSYVCISNPLPHNGDACNADSDGCTLNDTCDNGDCIAGDPPDCSSENDDCNIGACSSTGDNTYVCVKDPTSLNGSICNADSDGCTIDDTCTNGTCTAGILADCSEESDQCNTGVCQSTGDNSYDCQKDPTSHEGNACDDMSLCTTDEVCTNGFCIGTEPDCDDTFVCTTDSCNTETGECENIPDNTACDDQNDCTTDVCLVESGCDYSNQPDWSSCDDDNAYACFVGQCEELGENDTCETAIELTTDVPYNGNLDNFHAWKDGSDACSVDNLAGQDAFFQFAFEAGETYSITVTPDSSLDVAMVAWASCDPDSECMMAVDDSGEGETETAGDIHADSNGILIVQVIDVTSDPSRGNKEFTILVESESVVDGDMDDDDDFEPDGDHEGIIDGDTDSDTVDGDEDSVDGDHPIDGDEDSIVDGDESTDGDWDTETPTTDGDVIIDGDEPADGDTGEDLPSDGSGVGGCSSSGGGTGAILLIMLLWVTILFRRRKKITL